MAYYNTTIDPTGHKGLTRRTVLAAFSAPLVLPNVGDAFHAFSQDVRPPNDPTVLPFITDATEDERAAGAAPRCFWSVSPSGNYGADCATGARYGALALDYMSVNGTPQIMQWAVFDMMSMDRRHSGIEVGFLSTFGRAATSAHGRRTLLEGVAA
jgi:hypothetical protein